MTEDSSKKFTNQLITDTSTIQQFEYKAEQKEPYLRRTTSFYFDEKEKNGFGKHMNYNILFMKTVKEFVIVFSINQGLFLC